MHVSDEIQEMLLAGLRESMREKMEYHNTAVDQIEKQIHVLQHRIDQVYMDKLDGKIDEVFWSRQSKKWMYDKEELALKLLNHQQADTSYLENANLILELAKKASRLFKGATHEQKRRLAVILFSNSTLKDGNVDLQLRTPYDLILESSKSGNWRPLIDYFRTKDTYWESIYELCNKLTTVLNHHIIHRNQ